VPPRKHPGYEKNVFINCPFDDAYRPLFHAIVFTIHDVGFNPRCALEASNAGQFRLSKILDIISECKYGVHDLSRTELDSANQLPRFNMPLELGLDLSCRRFGRNYHQEKVILILDREPYRYQKFISDISGQDIYAHNSDETQVIETVRDWLSPEIDPNVVIIPSGKALHQRYVTFRNALPALCASMRRDPNNLPFPDFSFAVAHWITLNPI
jgi:hypothetical protein